MGEGDREKKEEQPAVVKEKVRQSRNNKFRRPFTAALSSNEKWVCHRRRRRRKRRRRKIG
jgi:hypothetical protein